MKIKNLKLNYHQIHDIKRQLINVGVPQQVRFKYADNIHSAHDTAREVLVTLLCREKEGRGYSGGHNTAIQQNWDTYHAAPEKKCVASLLMERSGRFTGYMPITLSFFIEKIELVNLEYAEHVIYNQDDITRLARFAPELASTL